VEGGGKPSFLHVSLAGPATPFSPCLWSNTAAGGAFSSVEVYTFSPHNTELPETELALENARLRLYSFSVTTAGDIQQTMSFDYERVHWRHREFDEQGDVQRVVETDWSVWEKR